MSSGNGGNGNGDGLRSLLIGFLGSYNDKVLATIDDLEELSKLWIGADCDNVLEKKVEVKLVAVLTSFSDNEKIFEIWELAHGRLKAVFEPKIQAIVEDLGSDAFLDPEKCPKWVIRVLKRELTLPAISADVFSKKVEAAFPQVS